MDDVRARVDRLYRDEFGRILPTLIRVVGDFGAAQDALQEAFEAALSQWPRDGVPATPRAWIVQVAKHHAVDRVRSATRLREREPQLELLARLDQELASGDAPPPTIADDTLRLLFTCCHPALAMEAQVALALRTLCGLTTEEIARAFLVPAATMAQRLVRAQRKIRDSKIPYLVPEPEALPERIDAVLATVYLVFNEGYSASSGSEWVRVDLAEEAIRLGALFCDLIPRAPEASALLGLMLLHHARRGARLSAEGGIVLLDRQDRSRWDRAQIAAGVQRLERALSLGARGPYAIQAAIAALHAQAPTAADTDWPQIVGLYDRLLALQPSPVVALNRAAAIAMAHGSEHGLALIDDLESSGALRDYPPLAAAKADLLRRLGRVEDAARAYRRALALTHNEAERRYLAGRLAELSEPADAKAPRTK